MCELIIKFARFTSNASSFFKRICTILEGEGVKYNQQVLIELVNKYFPDFRRCLNELQRYSVSGEIDSVF